MTSKKKREIIAQIEEIIKDYYDHLKNYGDSSGIQNAEETRKLNKILTRAIAGASRAVSKDSTYYLSIEKDFVKYYEERQRAVAKFQHEARDKGIENILKLSISDREKSIRIQQFLRNLELETFSKFSVLRNQNFDDF